MLTVEQVAERLSVSRRTVFRLIGEEEIRIVHIGRLTRIAESDLNDYIEKLRRESGSN